LFSVGTLHLHATADAVEERWLRVLDEGAGVELGLVHATLAELIQAADDAGPPSGTRLGPLGELALVDAVADQAEGPFAAIAPSRGLRRSLARLFSSLRRVGIAAAALAEAVRTAGLDGHARELARAFAAYERLLAAGDLFDAAGAWRRGCRWLAEGVRLRMLDGVDAVEIHGFVDWDGPRLLALDALLARRLTVRVELPAVSPDDPSLARALAPALGALEARHAEAGLELVTSPLPAAPRPAFIAAATPFVEAREIARRVRDLLDGGAAPETIAVCAASSSRRMHLSLALARYGVPIAERRRGVAAAAPPVRIALGLYELIEERLPRERLIALVSSRYVSAAVDGGSYLPAHRIARALREAGVGDASSGGGEGGYGPRLAAWARGQAPSRQAEAERIAARVSALVALIGTLPDEVSCAEHARALRAVLDRLELFSRARGAVSDGGAHESETRALARDQAAARELQLALDDLPRAAARAGLASARLPRARFARLLGEALAQTALASGGARGAAVELTDLAGLDGRAVAHLFVAGMCDGEIPARAPEDPLLADDQRLALNRALGRPALPLGTRADELWPLTFRLALGRAAAVTLSFSRTDEDGAPLLRAPFVDELQPSAAELVEVARDPLPRIAEARSLDELTARVALECRGDRASRLSAPDREGSTELYRLLAARAPARMARIEHLAAVERQRERFFAGDVTAHPFVGELREPSLLAALAARLPGREAAPLSASAVETWAACPFQFFLKHLLGAVPIEEVDDELDPLARGRLHHRVLERLFRRLATEGRLPLTGDPAEAALLATATDEVVEEWKHTRPIGHPGLFAIWERRLRRQLESLLDGERTSPPAAGCVPARFEERFGPLGIAAPDGDGELFVHGTIDRIDLGDGKAAVFDYKTGGRRRYAEQLKPEALCVTSWQLPLYAAAVRAQLGGTVEASYYSLRDGEVTRPVNDVDLFALDDLGRLRARQKGARNLGDALWEVHRAMAGGDFVVRPRERSCERCRMESACRIMRAVEPGEELV
jgi:hypothetical protein